MISVREARIRHDFCQNALQSRLLYLLDLCLLLLSLTFSSTFFVSLVIVFFLLWVAAFRFRLLIYLSLHRLDEKLDLLTV